MPFAQRRPAQPERLPKHLFRLLVLALIPQHRRHVVHAFQCVGMFFVEEFAGSYVLGLHCADPSDVVVLRFRWRGHL
jgi:hypothetical protein